MMGPLLLLLTAVLWGSSFVAQKASADLLGPFAVLFGRSVLAAAFLFVWQRFSKGSGFTRAAWIGGALSGLALFLAMLAQQLGIATTTPGISAFLTSNYILFVPVIAMLVGRRTRWSTWAGVAVALAGSYFICIDPAEGSFAIGAGEAWTLACALLFALQIIVVDRFASGTDVLAFSCVSQVTIIALSVPFLFLPSEASHWTPSVLKASVMPVLYLGIVSSGIAYTLQNFGQVRTPPALAAILMSLEAVFGTLAGYLWYGDVLTARQSVGCALLFGAALSSSLLATRRA